MALTTAIVSNASNHLESITKAILITLFRQIEVYRRNALIFSADLSTRIDAAEGTDKARMLNAVMSEIDKLGIGEVEIRGDEDAVWWSQAKEREALLTTAFLTLYDDVVEGTGTTAEGVIPSKGLYGDFAVGQRPQLLDRFGTSEKLCSNCLTSIPCGCTTKYRLKSYPF